MLNKSLNLSFLWLVYRTKKTSAQSQLHKYNATKFLSSHILIFERRYILLIIKEQANFRLGNYLRFYMPWDLFPLLYAFFHFWGYMMHLISNSTNFSCSKSSFCQMIRTFTRMICTLYCPSICLISVKSLDILNWHPVDTCTSGIPTVGHISVRVSPSTGSTSKTHCNKLWFSFL